jgi:hypothetical protein
MNLTLLQKNMRAIALSACALAAMSSYAQDVTTFECETPDESKYVEIDERTGCSGASALCFHSWKGGYANYIFDAPQAGTYDITFHYVTCEPRWFSVKVNDQPMKAICCSETTPNWSGEPGTDPETGDQIPGVLTKTIQVYMTEGENVIQLQGLYGYDATTNQYRSKPYSPILDKMDIKYSETQLGEVADAPEQIERECEDYSTIIGSAFTKNMGAFSGGVGVNLNKADGGFTYNVNATKAGVYKLDIYYTYMQERWITVKAGDTKSINVQFNNTTDSWEGTSNNDEADHPTFYQRSVLIWLEAGENVITFKSYTTPGTGYTDSPSMDKFTLDLIECSEFVKPEYETMAYKASLADIAKLTADSEIDVNTLSDHNEFTGVTLAGKTSLTVTAELPYPFQINGYTYSTKNNNEDWVVETSSDGTTWSEVTPNSNKKEGTIYSYTQTPGSDAVKYIRLVATGNEDVNLNELQLFGTPCVADGQQFPKGIFKADDAYDCNNEGYPNWNQLPEHLFVDDLNKLFAFKKGDEDVYVSVQLTEDTKATSYMIATSELWHAPSAWEIWGYDTESNDWVLLDEQKDVAFVANGSTLFFRINEPKTCSEYKIVFKNAEVELSKWQMFTEEQDVVTAISTIKTEDNATVGISVCNGKLTLSSDKATGYDIYSLQGCSIANGTVKGTANVALPAGIYLVKVGNKVIKAAVK